MTAVKMPQLGETVIEGTILKWLKQEGDQVALDEPLFEISTDKVDTEVPSSAAGTLTKILVPEGETVAVGTELAEISEEGGAGGAGAPGAAAQLAAAGSGGRRDLVRDLPGATMLPPLRHHPLPRRPPPLRPPRRCLRRWRLRRRRSRRLPDRGPRSQILSPLVRRLASEHGVDLGQVSGTGTGGRITKNDVLGFVATQGAAAPVRAPAAAAAAPPSRRNPRLRPRPPPRRRLRSPRPRRWGVARRSFRSRTSGGRSPST